ncbi:MAG TPA: YoaK family protein, partial [Bryocella sp.]|nr:YoaK family protein [Bryocella sp.]
MQIPRESHLTGLPESAIFAAVGGLLDAFTWLAHGHTFANSMTGNLVLFGLNTVQHDWGSAWRHLIALVSFALGVSTARSICQTRL